MKTKIHYCDGRYTADFATADDAYASLMAEYGPITVQGKGILNDIHGINIRDDETGERIGIITRHGEDDVVFWGDEGNGL